jgi:hypothetical protein
MGTLVTLTQVIQARRMYVPLIEYILEQSEQAEASQRKGAPGAERGDKEADIERYNGEQVHDRERSQRVSQPPKRPAQIDEKVDDKSHTYCCTSNTIQCRLEHKHDDGHQTALQGMQT